MLDYLYNKPEVLVPIVFGIFIIVRIIYVIKHPEELNPETDEKYFDTDYPTYKPTQEKDNKIYCPFCGASFYNQDGFNVHLLNDHNK